MAGTVSLYKEITIEGKRKFVPINLGRGRQSEQPGSFYLRYHCPDKNKRTWENVGQDFALAKTARTEKEQFLKLRLSAGAAGITLPIEKKATDEPVTLQQAIDKYLEHIRERVTGLELRPLTLVTGGFILRCWRGSGEITAYRMLTGVLQVGSKSAADLLQRCCHLTADV